MSRIKMNIGDLVYVPHLKTYGQIQDINWNRTRVKTVRIVDANGKVNIIDVVHEVVEAVNLIERIIVLIKQFFTRKTEQS